MPTTASLGKHEVRAERAELPRVQERLRPLVAQALALLATSRHSWAHPLAWVLRTRWIRAADLRWHLGAHELWHPSGFTCVPLPLIWLDDQLVERGRELGSYGRGACLQTLLHEAAHQLGAVWPEWRNWIGDHDCYGPDRNAADAIAEAIMRETYRSSRYAGEEISYKSPLEKLGLIRR